MQIEIDMKDALALLTAAPEHVVKSATRALNRAGASGTTLASRLIAKDLGVGARVVRAKLSFRPATYTRPVAFIIPGKRPLSVVALKGVKQTEQGVHYQLGGERKLIPSAFIRTMTSGHVGVFTRRAVLTKRTRGRAGKTMNLSLDQHNAPALGGLLDKHRSEIETHVQTVYEAEFARQMARLGAGAT